MAAVGGGAPVYSGYGTAPKVRLEVIGEAFQLFLQQAVTWIMAVLVMVVAMIVPVILFVIGSVGSAVMGAVAGRGGAVVGGLGAMVMSLLGFVLAIILGTLVAGGMYRMAIKQVRGEPIQLSDLWSVTDVLTQLVIVGVLMGLAISITMPMFVLPGLIVAGLLMLSVPLVVDQKMGAIDALTRSFNTMKGDWLMAAVLVLVLGLVSMVGHMVVIGGFVTFPVAILTITLVYRDFILGNGTPTPGAPTPYPVGTTPGYTTETYTPQPPPTEPR